MWNFAVTRSESSNPLIRVLLLFLPIVLLTGASALYIYQAELSSVHAEHAGTAQDRLRVGTRALTRTLQTAARDLNYLASRRLNQQLIDNPTETNLAILAADWVAFSQAKQFYDKIRWIDVTGMERLRVDYEKPEPIVIPRDRLQNKRERYFFSDTNSLKAGEVYISPLDLNVEEDRIEIPYKPTIRFGVPMFDSKGARRGILLINYSADILLERFAHYEGAQERPTWLVNQDGYWLKGETPDDEFGFMFGRDDLTMEKRYPQAWQKILEEKEGLFETQDGLWTFDTLCPFDKECLLNAMQTDINDRPEFAGTATSEMNGHRYFWKAVYLLPADKYDAGMTSFAGKLAGIAFLVLILFFIGIRRLVHFQKNTRVRLEKIVEQRTRDLQVANEQLSVQQLRMSSLIQTMPDLIWLKDVNGVYLLCNRFFENFFGAKESEIVGKTDYDFVPAELADFFRANDQAAIEAGEARINEEWVTLADDGRRMLLETTKVPVQTATGKLIGVLGIGRDITERKEAEAREHRLTNIYRALSATNDAIVHQQAESDLFPLICRIAVEYGGMILAGVRVADETGERIIPAASVGKGAAFMESIVILTKADVPEGLGPIGVAYREKRCVVVNDISSEESYIPWREKAEEYGLKSMAAFPVLRRGRAYAVFAVYSDQVNAFDQEIVHLLEEMAANISFALDNFDRENLRQQAETALRESEARLRRITYEAPFPMMIHAEDGEILQNNRSLYKITGYLPSEIPNMAIWAEKAFRDRATQVMDEMQYFYGIKEQTDNGEYVVHCKDGTRRIWHFVSSPIGKLPDGRRAIISMASDITERKEAEESLRLAAMVYEDSSEAMMITDADNVIIAVNPAFEHITGYIAEEVKGKHADLLKSGLHGDDVDKAIKESLKDSGYWKGELWSRRKNGEAYIALVTVNTTFNPDGSVHRRVALFSDITQKKEIEDRIWNQANFDVLTGLPNRNMFRDHLKQAMRKARRANMPMALMFLDLDGFKYVNDTLGHDMGDVLLKEAAHRLNSCMRDSDTVARLGGDEFTVIVSDLHDVGNVNRVARHILKRLSEPFQLGDEIVHVSASIGITLYPNDTTEIENLLRNADQAMYAAKQEGRNRYHYFTESMQEAAQAKMRLVNDLRVALEGDQFEVVYQPIVDLATGAIHKAEALIRWRHPVRGLINPIEFITTAEDTGMITAFGNWVFHQAASQSAQWRALHHPQFQISVNISPVQFRNGNLSLSTWFDHLQHIGLPGQGIVIEITEGLLLDAGAKVMDQLLAFRDAGIEVALDDFGVGYSSLSYLKKFDIDYLKIDQIFISNLAPGSDDMALCEAIIVMAHKLGIKVIAEGVETKEQRDLLLAAGCDYVQGYLYSGPVPPDEFEKLLKTDPYISQ